MIESLPQGLRIPMHRTAFLAYWGKILAKEHPDASCTSVIPYFTKGCFPHITHFIIRKHGTGHHIS